MAKTIITHGFKVHTHNLLKEIADCGLPRTAGVLKAPLNIFQGLLGMVAERASQLNDPKLNALMCRLTLYEISEPTSKEYNPKLVEEIIQKAK